MTIFEQIFVGFTLPIAIPAAILLDTKSGQYLARKTPYRPRLLNWLIALYGGYFWLPCPICGKNYGGHEWRGDGLQKSRYSGIGVCWKCQDKADRTNKANNYFKPEFVDYYQKSKGASDEKNIISN